MITIYRLLAPIGFVYYASSTDGYGWTLINPSLHSLSFASFQHPQPPFCHPLPIFAEVSSTSDIRTLEHTHPELFL